ncbi:MAG: hypothetical protein IKT40_11930 [Bacilli bacterium]|nr:hypothetical protein [Bacilli bacterium]
MSQENNTKVIDNEITTELIEKTISAPMFLLFAEFLGYTSPLIEWAEEACKDKNCPEFKQQILTVDAIGVLKQILKDGHTLEDLRNWYDEIHDLLLQKYEPQTTNANESDLPF